jgi:hypothetical protein
MKRALDVTQVPDVVRSALEELPDEMLVEIETDLLALDMQSLSLASTTLRAVIARHVTEAYVRLMNGLTMRVHRWDARRPLNVPGVEGLLVRFLEHVPMSALWLARRANLGPAILPADLARLRAPLWVPFDIDGPDKSKHSGWLRPGSILDPVRYPTFATMWLSVLDIGLRPHAYYLPWSLVTRFIYIWAERDASSCMAHLLVVVHAMVAQTTLAMAHVIRGGSLSEIILWLRTALLYVILKHKLPAISLASWASHMDTTRPPGVEQTLLTGTWSPIREVLFDFWFTAPTDMRVDLGAFARRIRLRSSILEDPDLDEVLTALEALPPPTDNV